MEEKSRESVSEQDVLRLASNICIKLNINVDQLPSSIQQLHSAFSIKIIETMCCDRLKNTIQHASCIDDEVLNYSLVLYALQNDILGENLDHIAAADLAKFETIALHNLYEIFFYLADFVVTETGKKFFASSSWSFEALKFCEKKISSNNLLLTTPDTKECEPQLKSIEPHIIDLGALDRSSNDAQDSQTAPESEKPTEAQTENVDPDFESKTREFLLTLFKNELGIDRIPARLMRQMSSTLREKIRLFAALKAHRAQLKRVRRMRASELATRQRARIGFVDEHLQDLYAKKCKDIETEREKNANKAIKDCKIQNIRAKHILAENQFETKKRDAEIERQNEKKIRKKFDEKIKEIGEDILHHHAAKLEKDARGTHAGR